MGKTDTSALKMGIIGSTRLTQMLFEFLIPRVNIVFLMDLPEDQLSLKTDAVHLDRYCDEQGIPILKPQKLTRITAEVRRFNPDLIVVSGDSRIIPEEILVIPRLGIVGSHGALLPDVKGAASLVWGRMFDLGWWGVSLFYLRPDVDVGNIIATARFEYPSTWTMREFVDAANEATMSLFKDTFSDVCIGTPEVRINSPADIRVSIHTDSFKAKQVFIQAREEGKTIYLPRRDLSDGIVRDHWPPKFIAAFKAAQDHPYPKYK